MLVPHRRENPKLGETRLAADQIENALIFVRLQAVLGHQRGRDGGVIGDHGRYVTCVRGDFTPRRGASTPNYSIGLFLAAVSLCRDQTLLVASEKEHPGV